jgi:mycothiol synthase
MASETLQVTRCPPQRASEALSLALCELAPSQRREIAGAWLCAADPDCLANEPLFIALRGEQLCGAAWGQTQAGNIAVFWPPKLIAGEDRDTGCRLAERVVEALDDANVEMTQILIPSDDPDVYRVLQHTNFRQLADLLYLTCEFERFPRAASVPAELDFESYEGSHRARLMRLIDRTYEGTLDCTALNGVRSVADVVTGYEATGVFPPQNWVIVRADSADVGVLLLADHPRARHWELMYMGLAPEARGRGWGRHITQHALWLARQADVERIVLAVDAVNEPALRMYSSTGFEMWDRRTVYVRFPKKNRYSTLMRR